MIVGDRSEKALAQEVAELAVRHLPEADRQAVRSVAGELEIGDLAALLAEATVMLASDSGPPGTWPRPWGLRQWVFSGWETSSTQDRAAGACTASICRGRHSARDAEWISRRWAGRHRIAATTTPW